MVNLKDDILKGAFIGVVITVVIILICFLGYETGVTSMEQEAVEMKVAEYITTNGRTTFHWNTAP